VYYTLFRGICQEVFEVFLDPAQAEFLDEDTKNAEGADAHEANQYKDWQRKVECAIIIFHAPIITTSHPWVKHKPGKINRPKSSMAKDLCTSGAAARQKKARENPPNPGVTKPAADGLSCVIL